MTTIDIAELSSPVKKTITLQKSSNTSLTFLGDIENQIVVSESNSNIIVKAYAKRTLIGGEEVVDKTKTLATYIFKNGAKVGNEGSLILKSNYYDTINLLKDYIYKPVKKNNKYTGTFLQEEVSSTSKNETFALGTGSDIINYNFNHAQGNDIIVCSKGQKLALNFENDEEIVYTYKKSGNNAIIKATKYFDTTYNIKAVISVSSERNQWGLYDIAIKAYDYNSDKHSYSKTPDVSVKLGQGLVATGAQLKQFGLKTGKSATLYVMSPYSTNEIENSLFYSTSFSSLDNFISDYTKKAPKLSESSQITLQDYFKNSNPNAITGNFDVDTLREVVNNSYLKYKNETKKNLTIKDTFFDEDIYGGKKNDKISSSKGDDTIDAGKGNDTITLGSGNKNINIKYGDGNDTIVNAHKANAIELNINMGSNFADYYYTKSGNNLIINHSYINGSGVEKVEKTIIKDYFLNKNYDNTNLTINYGTPSVVLSHNITEALTLGKNMLAGEAIKFNYSSDTKNKSISGTSLSDYIIAGRNTTKISAGNGNNDIQFNSKGKQITAISGSGDDIYRISNMSVSHDITDKGGTDSINLYNGEFSANDFTLLFDVIADGGESKKNNDLETLHIIYNNNYDTNNSANYIAKKGIKGLLNTVNIKNFFTKTGEKGSGCIENITFNNTDGYDFAVGTNWSEINEIRSQVAGWLAENNYNSAIDVINSKNSDDINTLMQMYTNITVQDYLA